MGILKGAVFLIIMMTSTISLAMKCNESGISKSLNDFSEIKQKPFSNEIISITRGKETIQLFPEKEKAKKRLDILKAATPYVFKQMSLNGLNCGLILVDQFAQILEKEREGKDLEYHAFAQRMDNHRDLAWYIIRWSRALMALDEGIPSLSVWAHKVYPTPAGNFSVEFDDTVVFGDSNETIKLYSLPKLKNNQNEVINSAKILDNGKYEVTLKFDVLQPNYDFNDLVFDESNSKKNQNLLPLIPTQIALQFYLGVDQKRFDGSDILLNGNELSVRVEMDKETMETVKAIGGNLAILMRFNALFDGKRDVFLTTDYL